MKIAKFRIGLVTLLSTAIASLVLLTVGMTALVGWWGVRAATIDLVDEIGVASIRQLETALSHQLLPSRLKVEAIGTMVENGRLDLSDSQTLKAVLSAGLAADPFLAAVVIITSDYREISARREPSGEVRAVDRDGAASPTLTARLDRARERKGTWWGEPLYAELVGDAVINVRHSIWLNDSFVGFVGAAITTTKLRELVGELSQQGGALVTPFVLYGRDRVLAYSGSKPTRSGSLDEPLPKLETVEFPALAAIWDATEVHHLPRAKSMGIKAGRLTIAGELFVVLQKQVPGFGHEPWTIGIILPDEELNQYFETLRRTGSAAIALTLAGGLLSLLIGQMIGRPIRSVVVNAGHVAAMDLKDVQNLPPSRISELDSLATAFNHMLGAMRAFERYVPKSLVIRLIRSGAIERQASRERDLTVMFTDIAGFTRAAEGMPARNVADFLNEHFALITAAVEAEGGTVDKFLGDGMMAFWGAPEKLKNRAGRACRAALGIRAAIRADNGRRVAAGEQPIRLRIGIHRGPLVVGNIGAPGRVNYTVVGDTVNVAQRLQEFGRQLDHSADVIVVASRAVAEEAGGDFVFASAGWAELSGRDEHVEAWRLIDFARH